MNEMLERHLREALTTKAVNAMAGTDSEHELARMKHRLGQERSRRRLSMAFAAAAACALLAGALALTLALSRHTARTSPAHQPRPTPSAPPSAPAGFPVGSWAKIHQQFRETLVFSDAGTVKLQDTRGQSTEAVLYPAPREATFTGGDNAFCPPNVPGTYRWTVTSKHRLTFTLVGEDNCQSRVGYLTGSLWRFTG